MRRQKAQLDGQRNQNRSDFRKIMCSQEDTANWLRRGEDRVTAEEIQYSQKKKQKLHFHLKSHMAPLSVRTPKTFKLLAEIQNLFNFGGGKSS